MCVLVAGEMTERHRERMEGDEAEEDEEEAYMKSLTASLLIQTPLQVDRHLEPFNAK